MRASLLGYFFGMIMVLTATVVLLPSLSNISTIGSGRHYPHSAIARTVTVELQRHSPSSAKDVSPVVSTAKADTKQIKHYNPTLLISSALFASAGTMEIPTLRAASCAFFCTEE